VTVIRDIKIATEDAISEAVVEKIVAQCAPHLVIKGKYGRCGNGYLKKRVLSFCQASRFTPFIVLTDLDTLPCAVTLRNQWLGSQAPQAQFLLRVAIREVESWLLADRDSFARFTGCKPSHITITPENLLDPKAELVRLVSRYGKRSLREQIVPKPNFTVKVGASYNEALCEYVREDWNPEKGAPHSDSLMRAIASIKRL
jgi:Domain of unknown function (DUF4276)